MAKTLRRAYQFTTGRKTGNKNTTTFLTREVEDGVISTGRRRPKYILRNLRGQGKNSSKKSNAKEIIRRCRRLING